MSARSSAASAQSPAGPGQSSPAQDPSRFRTSPLLIMEDILDGLAVLNYQDRFCVPTNRPPLPHGFFAVPGDRAQQFSYLQVNTANSRVDEVGDVIPVPHTMCVSRLHTHSSGSILLVGPVEWWEAAHGDRGEHVLRGSSAI